MQAASNIGVTVTASMFDNQWTGRVTLPSGREYTALFAGDPPTESHVLASFLDDKESGALKRNWKEV